MDYPYGYGNGSYGNGMSQGYSQGYQGYQYSNGQQQRSVENTFAWVYGDAGAKAFPVAPGKTVLLMDSERPILYLKSTDMNGRPQPMEVYELTRVDQQMYQSQRPMISQAPQGDMAEYVKKADLESEVTKILHQNQMGGMNGNGNSYGNPSEGNQR